MTKMNKITFVFKMLWRMFNLTILRRAVQMSFIKEDGRWYVDFPEYPWSKANLEMVLGADNLLEDIAVQQKSSNNVTVQLSTKPFSFGEHYKLKLITTNQLPDNYDNSYGRWYAVNYNINDEEMNLIWLCPVMIYTFGHYPKTIFINI